MFNIPHGAVYLYIACCYALAALGVLPALYEAMVPAYLALAYGH